MTTEVTRQKPEQGQSLIAILNQAMPELRRMAPKYVNPSRLIALAIEAKMRNPLLANCSPISVLNFCKICAERGTDRIGAGGMWAVPFYNSKTKTFDMTPIPDWRFIVETAKKAKAIKHATAAAIFEGDTYEIEQGLEPKLVHRPVVGPARGKPIIAYCAYTLPDGSRDFDFMEWAEIISIRDRTNAWKSHIEKGTSNPWVTDEIEQGKKTVVKRAMKIFQGASPELTALLDLDNASMGFAGLTDDVREPISMPVPTGPTIDATADAPPSPTPPSSKDAPPAAPEGSDAPNADPFFEGRVERVAKKENAKKAGTYRYGILIAGCEWCNTFSEDFFNSAQTAKDEGRAVRIHYQEGKYGRDITGMEVLGYAAEPPADAQPEPDAGAGAGLPF